ncbi:uncharacterized protein LOC111131663 isoform X3 [Crassostrea virginica]
MFGLHNFIHSSRIIEDMVKKDKVDILDLFLDNGIDIGHFLSEEGQAFGKPRVILDDMASPFGQADIMIDNTTPPLSQTEIVYDMSTPLAQLDTQQQDMTLNNTIYSGPDFLIDNVSAEVEVPQEITVQVIEDPVIEVMSENSSISTSLYDSTCSSEGFQHLEESVTTQFPFDDLDPSQAFFAEEVSKSELADIDLSPLLKEEIKHKIKRRRMAEGKEEIRVEFKEPSPEKLTKEEEEHRRIKREKNKLAAQKCRSKKRKLADTLEEETMKLEERQEKLQEQVQKLREEREHLMDLLKIHSQVCPKMARLGS